MAFPVPPIDPNYPIPNNPFYYPEQNYLKGEYSPFIIGTGLILDNQTGILSAVGSGGSGGVLALLAGEGIYLTANTGTVTVSNTGVIDLVAGSGINIAKVGGTYTITNIAPGGSPTGTVTQVNTGAGLTGGPITSSGTISLTPTGVAAATYTNPTITVDEYGRISFAAPGVAAGAFPVQATLPLVSNGLLPSTLSINAASTTTCGAVQLNDTVTSTSTTQAATASAAKCAYDTANTAYTTSVTALNLATTANANAANALLTANNAELCASDALTQVVIAQATANSAVTAAAAAQSTATTALGIGILAQNRANAAYDSAEVRIPCSAFFQKGDILVGLGSSPYTNLAVGANGYILTACSACPAGVTWAANAGSGSGSVTCIETGTGLVGGPITSSGVIALANTSVIAGTYLNASFTVNAQGQIISASGNPTPVRCVTGTYPVCVSAGLCPNVTVANATGTTVGVVRLYNALNSTSPLLALSAQQGKILNDKINSLCAGKVSSVSATSPLSATPGVNPIISIANASLGSKGAVQLYNNTDSTSISLALTAAQGKNLQDQITALASCSISVTGVSPISVTSGGAPVVSIDPASLTGAGAVQLYNALDSNGTDVALTAAQGKVLQDEISALTVAGGLIFAGTLDAGSGQLTTVSSEGSSAGFIVGGGLPAPDPANTDYFVIVVNPGSISPSGGGGPYDATQGDWFVSNGFSWQFLNISSTVAYATAVDAGIVCLATPAQAITGTNVTNALTPAAASAAYIGKSALPAKGSVLAASAASTPLALPVGLDAQVLTADSLTATGLKWANPVLPDTQVTSPVVNTGTSQAPIIGVQTATSGQLGAVQTGTNIDNTAGVISVKDSSTTQSGVVQLNDSVSSNSVTEALTANQGLNLQTQINSLTVATNLVFAGTFDAENSAMLSVTAEGAALGLNPGDNLPVPDATTLNYFVIVTVPGGYSPPGGGGPFAAGHGDWFMGAQTGVSLFVWQFLNVGNDLPLASTGTAGIVQLATAPQTDAGTCNNLAVTPYGAAQTYMRCSAYTAKGVLLGATGANVPVALPVGADGLILTACDSCPTGFDWLPAPSIPTDYISCSIITATGDLIVGASAGTPVALPVGSNGQVLVADDTCFGGVTWSDQSVDIPLSALTSKGALITASAAEVVATLAPGGDGQLLTACAACPDGLFWSTQPPAGIPCACVNGKGALITGFGPNFPVALPVGGDGYQLTACDACPTGLTWAVNVDIPCSIINAKGDLIAGLDVDAPAILPAGTNGQQLTVCSTCPTGLAWVTNTDISCSIVDAKGDLIVATANDTVTALPVGTNGQILTACSACASGVAWAQNAAIPCSLVFSKGVILGGTAAGLPNALSPSPSDGYVLTADSAATSMGIVWCPNAALTRVPCSAYSTKGVVLAGSLPGVPTAIPPAAADGQVLTSCSTCTTGLAFATPRVADAMLGNTCVDGFFSCDICPSASCMVFFLEPQSTCDQLITVDGWFCQIAIWNQKVNISVIACRGGSSSVLMYLPYSKNAFASTDAQCTPIGQTCYYRNYNRIPTCFILCVVGCTQDRGSDQVRTCARMEVVSIPTAIVF